MREAQKHTPHRQLLKLNPQPTQIMPKTKKVKWAETKNTRVVSIIFTVKPNHIHTWETDWPKTNDSMLEAVCVTGLVPPNTKNIQYLVKDEDGKRLEKGTLKVEPGEY